MATFHIPVPVTVSAGDIVASGVPAGHVLTADGAGGAAWADRLRVLAGAIEFGGTSAALHATVNTTGMAWSVAGSGGSIDLTADGVSEIVHQPCFAHAGGDWSFEGVRVAVYSSGTGFNFAVVNADGSPCTAALFYFMLIL